MLENLLDLVKKHAGNAIVNNPDIPNERNDEAIQETSSSITSSLQNILSQGGLSNVLKMFSGGDVNNSSAIQNISGGLIEKLKEKFGLDHQQASNVADQVVPNVMNEMVSKTNDPNDSSFDIQGIFNKLSGGKTGGFNIQGLLNKAKAGLDLDGDGDTDLSDLKSVFSGGASGITDKLKGLFN